jgi:hypothetical protein
MPAESAPEGQPLDLPPDIQLANRFIWHGMQAVYGSGRNTTVQPELAFADFTPDSGEPIGVTYHPNGTFPSPNDKRPWAYQVQRSIYPGYIATQTTIARAENNIPEAERVSGESLLIPEVIVELGAHASLRVMRRNFDLDDAERRYLEKTQYFFWPDRPAMRQDVFDTGEQNNHLVTHRASEQELRKLHGEVYAFGSCACALVVSGYYGPPTHVPLEGLRKLFGRMT